MKSLIISIQPYYVFLIIAHLMGWNIPQEKTLEVRKNYPKDLAWNKVAYIYCSRNRKSFNRIPKRYQPLMARFLGRVIGQFVCDYIEEIVAYGDTKSLNIFPDKTCLTEKEIGDYIGWNMGNYCSLKGYAWHISELKVYDKPKELKEFCKPCSDSYDPMYGSYCCDCDKRNALDRPFQSWGYVEGLK